MLATRLSIALLISLFWVLTVTACVTSNTVRDNQIEYQLKGPPCADGRLYAYGESCI